MEVQVERNFTVKGTINCSYRPGSPSPVIKQLANIEVELWQKSPLDVTFLGKGLTDPHGVFNITVRLKSPNPIIEDGKINGVFIKASYNGELIIGDNPY